ncbi:MAG: hypothetical protein RL208_283 [Pseudomonadota bacterium]|jgi:hypothetical protein
MENIIKQGNFNLSHTESDYELIGIVAYKDYRYPAKLTYSITKCVKVVIYDNDKFELKGLLNSIYEKDESINKMKIAKELDGELIFYTSVYGNPKKVKFHGLEFYGDFDNIITTVCEYCVIYDYNSNELNWNEECNAEFSLANIHNLFWNGFMNPRLQIKDLPLYNDCSFSIDYSYSSSLFLEESFYYNLKPETIDKQEYYKSNEEKINNGFKSMYEKFITDYGINENDIRPNAKIKNVLFKLSNTKTAIEDVGNLLKLFEIIIGRSVYCDTLVIKQGDVKADILYSFQVKEISENPIGYAFSLSRCLFNNRDFFKKWFELYGDVKIREILKFIFMIAYEGRYYPDFILMEAIAGLECIGKISNTEITGNDSVQYIQEALKYSIDALINEIYMLVDKNGNATSIKGKRRNIAKALGGFIRDSKAHGSKHINDVDNINKVNDLIRNGLADLLIKSIKCFVYKKLNLQEDAIKILLRYY